MAPEPDVASLDVVLLDYGVGNLRSVERALAHVGARVRRSTEVDVGEHEALVLPGVGAFAAAREKLGARWGELGAYARGGRPLLGICLGMQLLFEESHEHGVHEGLGVLPGVVEALPSDVVVPHMGWARCSDGEVVYFCHSYGVRAGPATVSTVHHGGAWTAMAQRGALTAFQFHPEKSGEAGLRLLRRFVRDAQARQAA